MTDCVRGSPVQASAAAVGAERQKKGGRVLFNSWKSRAAVFAVAATMAVPILGLASPAAAAGNSDNAKKCQQGGYVNYTTTSGARFNNAGDCTSYAAKGGTLVPLPDLRPEFTCTDDGHQLRCTGGVRNVGAAVADPTQVGVVIDTAGNPPTNITITGGATAPGQLFALAITVTADTEPRAGTLTVTADPNDLVVEGNESNNVFSRSFSLT